MGEREKVGGIGTKQILSQKLFPPEKYKIVTSEELMEREEIFKRSKKHDPDGFGYIPE
jgi:hypothetical protein